MTSFGITILGTAILGWMAYALVVSALIGSAAWCLDRTLGRLGFPTRWLWVGAMMLSLALPTIAVLAPGTDTAPSSGAGAVPVMGASADAPVEASLGARLEGAGPDIPWPIPGAHPWRVGSSTR